MKKKFLLTGGRAPATLEIARQLHAQGHLIYMAESQSAFLSRASNAVEKSFVVAPPRQDPSGFVRDLLRIVREISIDVLIPTCEEVFYVARGLEALRVSCAVWCDTLSNLHLLHNKYTFNREVRALCLPAPHTQLAETLEGVRAYAGSFPVVLKPAYSRFASQARILRSASELPSALAISPAQPWLLQEFIDGNELCTYSVCWEGELLSHSTYSHEFTAGRGAGISFEAVDHPRLREWVRAFARARKYTGQLSFDFIETSGGVLHPLECNPRATSGAHLFLPEDRLDQVFLRERGRKTLEPAPGRRAMILLAMLSYGLAGIKGRAKLAAWWRAVCSSREVIYQWADPLPAFYQFVGLYQFWRGSLREKKSIMEMSTHDIEWNGD